jgi:hypothetical protein
VRIEEHFIACVHTQTHYLPTSGGLAVPDGTLAGSFIDGGGTRHNVEVAIDACGTYLLMENDDFFRCHICV